MDSIVQHPSATLKRYEQCMNGEIGDVGHRPSAYGSADTEKVTHINDS